jgi:hypothetical protein
MRRSFCSLRVSLIGVFLLLFFALSFNAYACLIPIYGSVPMTAGPTCPAEDEQTSWQFCDTFKTLGFNGDNTDNGISPFAGAEAALSSVSEPVNCPGLPERRVQYRLPPPLETLLKTTVLRI